MHTMIRLSRALIFLSLLVTAPAQAEVRLVMFDQPGCVYCQRWTQEVGDVYAITAEGQRAPLWRMNIRDDLPASITLNSRPVYTPPFVLLNSDHSEVARIEGYPGEDFFWALLNSMLEAHISSESTIDE